MSKLTNSFPQMKIFMVEKGFYSINLTDRTIKKLGPVKRSYQLPSISQTSTPKMIKQSNTTRTSQFKSVGKNSQQEGQKNPQKRSIFQVSEKK